MQEIRCEIATAINFKSTATHSQVSNPYKAGVSNSSCSEGQIRSYKVTRGPHYDADATMAVPQPYKKQLSHIISCERYCEL